MLPLPNYLGNFDVCLGDIDTKSFDSLKELTAYIIDSYWKSSFEGSVGVDYQEFKKFLSLGKKANPAIYGFLFRPRGCYLRKRGKELTFMKETESLQNQPFVL